MDQTAFPWRDPPADSLLSRLLNGPVRPGRVAWIGLRTARREPVVTVREVMADPAHGLLGDRYGSPGGARQVTLIAAEDLAATAAFLGREAIPPERLRRNLLVAGINLAALRGRRFRVGDAVLEHTGDAQPCSRMEEELGPGGYNAVRGHGGITARVVEGGLIRLGDAIARIAASP